MQIDLRIHRGLIVVVPSWISITSLRNQKEISLAINKGLIVYIPA